MSAIKFAIQTLVCLNLFQAIISLEFNKYCQLTSECELESHIGCTHSSLRSSGYQIEHLKYSNRLSILNDLNQFRSDIANGNSRLRVESFPNMKKIVWNYELEKLLKLSIQKVDNVRFPCVLTSKSDRITQFFFILDKPKQSFTIEATFSDLLSDIIRRAVGSYRTASIDDIIAYSYVLNPDTLSMGCAVGSKINSGESSSMKSVFVRCAFNGTKIDKKQLKSYSGWPCTECIRNHMKCDEFFPGLCVSGIMKGYTGAQGNIGETGSRGRNGARGDVGEKGDDGKTGLPGLQGPQGEIGIKGDRGRYGLAGSTGDKGDRGKGIRGNPGIDGIRGKPGDEGTAGKKGDPGPVGAMGNHNSKKGEKGHKGKAIPGDQGYQGLKGETGNTGQIGLPGNKGPRGFSTLITKAQLLENCEKCEAGDIGPQGPPGIQGPKGISILNKQNKINC